MFFLLVNGRLKVVQVTAEGQQIVAHFVTPGQFFGIAVALGRPDYPGTAVAVAHSLVLSWPAAIWGKLAASHPGFAETALLSVGGYLQEALVRLRR
jgi:CRP-like cAMP-binding protein